MYGFTHLEEKLAGPEGGAVLQSSLQTLRAIAAEMREGIANGLSREDYAQAEKLLAAVSAAEKILLKPVKLKGA